MQPSTPQAVLGLLTSTTATPTRLGASVGVGVSNSADISVDVELDPELLPSESAVAGGMSRRCNSRA